MGLDDVIRNLVQGTAHRVTKDLQEKVMHEAWIGQDDTGAPVYASAKTRYAVVDAKPRKRSTGAGQELVSQHALTFLAYIPPNGTDGRREPIDLRDRLTLADGSTGPILSVEFTADGGSTTGKGYMYEVFLG